MTLPTPTALGSNGRSLSDAPATFEGLVAQMDSVLRELNRDILATEDRLSEQKQQRNRLEKTLRSLTGQATPSRGGKRAGITCSQCGKHKRSRVHTEQCKGEVYVNPGQAKVLAEA